MINFLHSYLPNPILISFGPINIYWYGIFIVTGILAGILVVLKLAPYYNMPKSIIIDSIFWLILGGIAGARLYHIILELPFYLERPLNMLKLWQGGLAFHGALIAGIFLIWFFAKKNNINFWLLTAIYVPGLALAQAIGRWGNYFNQEIFGQPTNLPWGIPIIPANRILDYYNSQFFHPTFLYESIGNFLIFAVLIFIHYLIIKKKNVLYQSVLINYLLMYSLLRFSMEFIRIDSTPMFLGLRWPQTISLLIIFFILLYGLLLKYKKHANFK